MSFAEIHNLSKFYDNHRAVEDINISINEGEVFALVGPDGAGKTTIMRAMCGLIGIDSGEITLGGLEVGKQQDQIKELIGYMPQQFSLYPDLSVEENLVFYGGLYGFTGKEYQERRDRLYEFSRLDAFAKRRASALSGGMKQKLALSCALMHDPKLLILDEPTTGVDPLSRRQFWEILLDLQKQGVTIVVSTPYMDEVERCDRAAFIIDGSVLSIDTPRGHSQSFGGVIFSALIEPSQDLMMAINALDGLSATRFGASLHIYAQSADRFERHRPQLNKLGIAPDQITSVQPELEDRFIQLMEQQS